MAVATVIGGDGRGHCWKNEGIVIVAETFDLFSFLLDTVVNGVLSMIVGGLRVKIWWWR